MAPGFLCNARFAACAKAPEGWRTPRRFAKFRARRQCAGFWTAAALCRFPVLAAWAVRSYRPGDDSSLHGRRGNLDLLVVELNRADLVQQFVLAIEHRNRVTE